MERGSALKRQGGMSVRQLIIAGATVLALCGPETYHSAFARACSLRGGMSDGRSLSAPAESGHPASGRRATASSQTTPIEGSLIRLNDQRISGKRDESAKWPALGQPGNAGDRHIINLPS